MSKVNMDSISFVANLIQKIDALRNENIASSSSDNIPSQEIRSIIGESMQKVSLLLGMDFPYFLWGPLYTEILSENILDNFWSKVKTWEENVLNFLETFNTSYGCCNICKSQVQYNLASDYFKIHQKKYGFPHWNKVFESDSQLHRSCPVCQSLDRDRMISLFLDMLQPDTGSTLKVLQIAPTIALRNYCESKNYIEHDSLDLFMEETTYQVDIQNLSMIQDKTYDLIICSHVLEHVSDDRKALLELYRILKDNGACIFLVPLIVGDTRTHTDECFSLNPEENWKRFGQDDRIRLYSRYDFFTKIIDTGYLLYLLDGDYFGKELWNENGLSDIHCLYVATKKDIGLGVKPYSKKENTQNLVSVILPTYNRDYCLKKSIDSILNQTYSNLELIIVDDHSTDNTLDILNTISDPRLRIISLPQNRGANHARNEGIKISKGNYIAFHDSDDEWLPQKLEKQMNLFSQCHWSDLGCVSCLTTRYFQNGTFLTIPDLETHGEHLMGNLSHYLEDHMLISTPTMVLKKEVFDTVGYFNEDLKRLQDWEFSIRLAQKYRILFIQESLVRAFEQKDSLSNNPKEYVRSIRYVIDLYKLYKSNPHAYKTLIISNLRIFLTKDFENDELQLFLSQIEHDNFFTPETLSEIHKLLKHHQNSTSPISRDDLSSLKRDLDVLRTDVEQNKRNLQELLWAQVFNSAKPAFPWLPNNLAFWPGRWGVGYQYMYVVSRILNELRPKSILETGLGQSTRLIGSYVKYISQLQACSHYVIEHDEHWINLFKEDFAPCPNTQIIHTKLSKINISRTPQPSNTYIYENFSEILGEKKFDFISLDGPYGTNDPNGFSRIDILNHLPHCLADNFCIVIDDYNRYGEKNTVSCIKVILEESSIPYCDTLYQGSKDLYLLASKSWNFLCTL